jgi:hypothetical protein
MTIRKGPLILKVIPASEPESRDSDMYLFWMPPAYHMPGLPLAGPGKPVPGYGQGQAYQSLLWT